MSKVSSVTVAKFGGTSLKNYQSMVRCANIVIEEPSVKVVVLSASAGVTNLLVDLTERGLSEAIASTLIDNIKTIQLDISASLFEQNQIEQNRVNGYVLNLIHELEYASQMLREQFSLKLVDEILSFGERFSSYLFTEIMTELLSNADDKPQLIRFDARRIIKTDSRFGHARPDLTAIKQQSQLSLNLPECLYITQGFVGEDSFGNTTTLGRGGSDFSAALIAEAINADKLQIWTDVAGIYSSDPRFVTKAKPIKTLSFNEAAELATFGAKVLHPATLLPAIRSKIDVFVGSSLEPAAGGTHLTTKPSTSGVRAIALRENQTLVTLSSPNMLLASGFLARVFAILAKYELSVDLITTSEISVALTFDNINGVSEGILPQECITELEDFCAVSIEGELSLVAVIGNHNPDHETISSTELLFKSLGDYQIRMICHGASRHNVCFLVKQSIAKDVVTNIHDQIFG